MSPAPTPPQTETWTTRKLLASMRTFLEGREINSARVVSEMLLAHVLDCERMRLYMEADRPATQPERDRLRELLTRAGGGEPVQYLVGEASFHCRTFEVNQSTLIPQPSTETLVEAALEHVRELELATPHVCDIGTGSGVIAISIAANITGARLIATDISDEALALAARNAERHGVGDDIEYRRGAGLEPFAPDETFDLLCSNPPYIPNECRDLMDASVREHVPESAWAGGPGGLSVIAPLIAGAASHLRAGGLLAIEIDTSHAEEVRRLADQVEELTDVRILDDHEGLARVLLARREPSITSG